MFAAMQTNTNPSTNNENSVSVPTPTTLPNLLKPYCEHLRVRNYCALTIEAQAKHLRYFQSFCDRLKIEQVSAVGWQEISSYQIELHQYR